MFCRADFHGDTRVVRTLGELEDGNKIVNEASDCLPVDVSIAQKLRMALTSNMP